MSEELNEEIRAKMEMILDSSGQKIKEEPISNVSLIGKAYESCDKQNLDLKLECLKLAYESVYKLDASTPIEWSRKSSSEKMEVVEGLFALADKNWEWLSQ